MPTALFKMDHTQPLIDSTIPELELLHRGKVRDVYSVDEDRLLLVATDRLSAFDCVLPTPIANKGAVLTALSEFWFGQLTGIIKNHLITTNIDEMPAPIGSHPELRGRSMLVKRTDVFPVECVVRGYLEGSGWKDYRAGGTVCGHRLPPGLKHCDRLLSPIFTPANKAAAGHDENIDQLEFARIVGHDVAALLKSTTLAIYKKASEFARSRGIIIADTKFEFGADSKGNIILIDEALTPDSSRFWDASSYEPGHPQPSFDKQFVREYLETLDWDKLPPAPPLPAEIAAATSERYVRAYELLTGSTFSVN
ncbi:MAG TPA: phosphoribosylaminoimidazolesuccinocarboxamide synthase [Pyrinomonadaceae bacterium]|jgi:phosphoribosylaminoimidazole-succinocarboxamide synthase|nr:phosphoribosylaminoimidazolesuccinocarboxamide synthase [Pyrinomonadaceae bacterium]HRA39330.1 phosphoribosylaminoimidazolesuccinocarboxamide synthase [Pyrinomonadaceae bacterium]